jgi:hypothetical protein
MQQIVTLTTNEFNNYIYIFCRFAESLADFRANSNAVKLVTAFTQLRINDEACWGENIRHVKARAGCMKGGQRYPLDSDVFKLSKIVNLQLQYRPA